MDRDTVPMRDSYCKRLLNCRPLKGRRSLTPRTDAASLRQADPEILQNLS